MDEKQELKFCPECGQDTLDIVYRGNIVYCTRDCSYKYEQPPAADPAWKYVERDGNPTEEDEYLIAVNITEPGATRDYWGRFGWRHYCNEDVYAWAECRPMPEPPPLLEGENG